MLPLSRLVDQTLGILASETTFPSSIKRTEIQCNKASDFRPPIFTSVSEVDVPSATSRPGIVSLFLSPCGAPRKRLRVLARPKRDASREEEREITSRESSLVQASSDFSRHLLHRASAVSCSLCSNTLSSKKKATMTDNRKYRIR